MNIRSMITPAVLAFTLVLGSAPVFAQDAAVPVDLSALTAAEKTALEDQCRQMQTDSDETVSSDSNSEDQMDNEGVGNTVVATAEICAELGLGEQ